MGFDTTCLLPSQIHNANIITGGTLPGKIKKTMEDQYSYPNLSESIIFTSVKLPATGTWL
jgi:hypothetical protein